MLNNTSQLVQRNIDRFSQQKSLLVMGPPADDLVNLVPSSSVISTTDITVYDYISAKKSEGQQVRLQTHAEKEPGTEGFSSILIFMPKSKDELRLKLINAHFLLNEKGTIFLVGAKREGIASANKALVELGGKALKVDSARHCTLWVIQPTSPAKPFDLSLWEHVYPASIGDKHVEICSLPGVFAHKRMDIGTEFLLSTIASKVPDFKGEWLDFGSGVGVIAAFMARLNTNLSITGVDSSALAIYCARRTFELNQAKGSFIASDGFRNIDSRRFDGIVTNPPFHTGVDTDYSVTESFILGAKKMLKKNGKLIMVANNFLDYDERLRQVFGNVETLASNTKFNVYLCCNFS